MKILVTVTHLGRSNGGVCTHIVDLCKGLIEKGHSVIVASDEGEYIEQLNSIDIKVIKMPFLKVSKSPQAFIKVLGDLNKITKNEKIDIIHCHGQSNIVFAQILRKIKGIPFIWTSHIDAIPQQQILKLLYKFKFTTLAVSTDLKNNLIENLGFDKSRIVVINNGISIEDFPKMNEEDRKKIRSKMNMREEEFVISMLTRVHSAKGHMYLLEAVNKLKQAYPHISIKICGTVSDPEGEEYKKSI